MRKRYQLKPTVEEDAELGSMILIYFSVCLEVFWKLCKVQVNTFILKLWLVV